MVTAMAGFPSDELTPFLVENFQEIDKAGSGSFGAVYQVTVNGFPCIAKRLHDILVGRNVGEKEKQFIRKRFRDECILLSRLRHPNIVQFIGVYYGEELTLVMERLYTDLEKCLNTHGNVPLPLQLSMLLDVAYGLLYLHSENPPIIHRDVKASNVLLTTDMRAKLADLGVSKILDVHPLSEVARTVCPGTPGVMPPEALVQNPLYTTKLDDFSFGTLVLHAVNHEFPVPFETDVFPKGEMHITKRRYALDKMGQGHCLHPLAMQCLQDNPQKRPTTSEICSVLESLSKQHDKKFKDVLDLYEALAASETALHEANTKNRVPEMQEVIKTRERELICALEEALAARQEVQAKAAQIKEYRAQALELEIRNKDLSQEMDKVRSALEIEKKKENHQNEKQKKTHFHRKNSGNSAPVDLKLLPCFHANCKSQTQNKITPEHQDSPPPLPPRTWKQLQQQTANCKSQTQNKITPEHQDSPPPLPPRTWKQLQRPRSTPAISALWQPDAPPVPQRRATDSKLECRICNKKFKSDENQVFQDHVGSCTFATLPLYKQHDDDQ